ncbi:MAG TPA: patatin-like phospholipase family protein, partial [Acetobacteraceae bacterium]|nr:patatin-like phospholipase family protein [Acetobacteraceae bacterium]
MMCFIRLLAVLAVGALVGCTYTFPNTPLVGHSSNTELLPIAPDTTRTADEPYIVISFSGGGIRATGFAYAVLNELAQVPDRSGRPFTADVQIISSASGGSVTAAWFGLTGDAGLPVLRRDFITQNNMAALESQLLNPATLVRLAGPNYSRVDVVRDYFKRHLFHHATIGDVYHRPGAPLIILNATDMGTGEVFSFRTDRFDDLCSDLSRFPLATAVAASSAFPIALTPISLKNFSGGGCPVNPYPTRVRIDLTTATRYLDLPAYKQALETVRMRGCPFPCADPAHRTPSVLYQHLLDGGLVDNLGTSAILRELFNPDPSSQLRRLNDGTIRNLVAIQVIARTSTPSPVSVQPATPGVVSVTNAVIDNPMNAATRGNAEIFETAIGDLRQAGRLRALAPAPVGIPDRIYGI